MKFVKATACLLIFAALLTGCHRGTSATTATTAATTTAAATNSSEIDSTIPTEGTRGEPDIGIDVKFKVLGTQNIKHTIDISQAKYVTSVEELPNYEILEEYDAAWFQEHALLVIYETVPGGKITVDIDSIKLDGSRADITLARKYDGKISTTSNVVWLLWAEVDRDLHYTWNITNPTLENNVSDK